MPREQLNESESVIRVLHLHAAGAQHAHTPLPRCTKPETPQGKVVSPFQRPEGHQSHLPGSGALRPAPSAPGLREDRYQDMRASRFETCSITTGGR